MGHRADKSFFERKRAWSRRNDVMCEQSPEARLTEGRKFRCPALPVGVFATPGRLDDAEPALPLIGWSKARV